MAPMKVIIDTDPGIDDAMALLFAHYANDIELLGITTVFGNGTIDTVTQNTLTICEQFQINAPVHQGAGAPLQVAVDPPPAFVHGNDGLGDIDAPKPKGAARNQSAANFIVETILKHPNEITVIGIGRLTNLAIALQQHPAIAQLVKKVVIMGGALGSNAHTGNVTPVAEANIYGDPHAADQVLTAPWPVTLVGLDVTMQCIMHRPQLQKICSAAGAAGRFMWAISRHFESFYSASRGINGFPMHDTCAIAYALAPHLFTTQSGAIRAVTQGISRGQTIMVSPDGKFPAGAWTDAPIQQGCIDIDAAAVLNLFQQVLTRP